MMTIHVPFNFLKPITQDSYQNFKFKTSVRNLEWHTSKNQCLNHLQSLKTNLRTNV